MERSGYAGSDPPVRHRRALRTMMPRPLVDCRWADYPWDAPAPERRWLDRLVCEENLWTCWEQLADRYAQNAIKPFSIEMGTMERQERPETSFIP